MAIPYITNRIWNIQCSSAIFPAINFNFCMAILQLAVWALGLFPFISNVGLLQVQGRCDGGATQRIRGPKSSRIRQAWRNFKRRSCPGYELGTWFHQMLGEVYGDLSNDNLRGYIYIYIYGTPPKNLPFYYFYWYLQCFLFIFMGYFSDVSLEYLFGGSFEG